MKKKRYNEEQIVRILREADKDPIAEIAKRHGVSEQSIYSWRKRFSSMTVNDVKQMRQLTMGYKFPKNGPESVLHRNIHVY
jgi:putative transposase